MLNSAGYEDDFDPYSAETQQRYNVNDLSQAVQQVDLSRVAYNQGNVRLPTLFFDS